MKRISAWVICLCLCVSVMACGQRSPIRDESVSLPSEDVPSVSTTTSVTTTTESAADTTTSTEETTTDTTTVTTDTTTTVTTTTAKLTTVTTTTTAKPTTTTTAKPTTSTTTAKPTTVTTTTTAPPVPKVELLAQEIPPKMAAYAARGEERTEWYEGVKKQQNQMGQHNEGMTAYYAEVLPTVLGAARGENRIFSPLSLYLSLGMLAEITDGNSRRQVLDLMGADSDMDRLAEKCAGLWNGVYIDDTVSTCRLSNSLWLSNTLLNKEKGYTGYRLDTVERLAQQYFATVYRGEMGSEAYNAALQNWVNDRTGGMLKGPASQLEMDENTALTLVNALYFKMKWYSSFQETVDGVFHTAQGDVTRPFMKLDEKEWVAGFGDHFTGVCVPLDGGRYPNNLIFQYNLVILLPDEGVTADALLDDPQALAFIERDETALHIDKKQKVVLSLPKFDVLSDMELSEQLKLLGVTDVFDEAKADFSSVLSEGNPTVELAEVRHATRVNIDEEGCEAASYTVVRPTMKGIYEPGVVLDFTVDRPFMFAVTGPGNTILFAGIIENP